MMKACDTSEGSLGEVPKESIRDVCVIYLD